jgi:hypothetical protein
MPQRRNYAGSTSHGFVNCRPGLRQIRRLAFYAEILELAPESLRLGNKFLTEKACF